MLRSAIPFLTLITLSVSVSAQATPGDAQAFADRLLSALRARDTTAVGAMLDPAFIIRPMRAEDSRPAMIRAAAGAMATPVSIRADSVTNGVSPSGSRNIHTTYATADKTRPVTFTLSASGRIVEAVGLFQVSYTGAAPTSAPTSTAPADPALARRLMTLREMDQRHRGRIVELLRAVPPGGQPSAEADSLRRLQASLDAAVLDSLRTIVRASGWPTMSRVGADAATAAFLVVQHSPLATQLEFLPQLEKAAAAGEARKSDVAMLVDRTLMLQGKKQIYGSQISAMTPGQSPSVWPIDDEAHVDERRAAVGLPPLREYLKRFGVDYQRPPLEWH